MLYLFELFFVFLVAVYVCWSLGFLLVLGKTKLYKLVVHRQLQTFSLTDKNIFKLYFHRRKMC